MTYTRLDANPIETLRVGVVGCGNWGPNHIRSLLALHDEGARMVVAADPDPERRRHVENMFPSVTVVSDASEVIDDPDIDAVVLATPARMHYEQAHQALLAGKHVLVEKPLTTDLNEAADLARLASAVDRVLMVGHTFQYSGAVDYIREAIRAGELGELAHIRSLRLNLGLFRSDINVLWDLAPHDLSILLYVLGRFPRAVHATGAARVDRTVIDIANMTLVFGDQLEANVIVSWLDPTKVRQMTFVGDRKMLVYDDMSTRGKIQVFDRGLGLSTNVDGSRTADSSHGLGGTLIPKIVETEPLLTECRHFIECCRLGKTPISGSGPGAAVTAIIEAAQQSVRYGGKRVELDMFEGAGPIDDWLDASASKFRIGRQLGLETNVATQRLMSDTGRRVSRDQEPFKAIVIDPDESRRLLAADALSSFEPGFDVVTVPDVDEAIEWMQSFSPDLLVVNESIGETMADQLMYFVNDNADCHRCRVISVGNTDGGGGPMASWRDVALDDRASLSEWLAAVQHVFDHT